MLTCRHLCSALSFGISWYVRFYWCSSHRSQRLFILETLGNDINCIYLACTELTKERWNTRIKKEMNDWLAIYRRQNVSVGRLDIPSAIFAFNGVLPKRLSLQHITCASWGVSICKWHITPERQSYYSLYSAINTLASHFTSYGAILKTHLWLSTWAPALMLKKTRILSNQNDITVEFLCDWWRPEVSLSQQEEAKILRALPASGHWVALNDSIASVLWCVKILVSLQTILWPVSKNRIADLSTSV